MELFGYKRTYKKNTIAYKQQINSMLERLNGEKAYGAMDMLIKSLRWLDVANAECPKGAKKKELAAIDRRVQIVMNEMNTLVRKKKFIALSGYSDMLAQFITDDRMVGKRDYTDEEFNKRKIQIVTKGDIFEALTTKSEIQKEIAKIKDEQKRYDVQSAEYEMLDTQRVDSDCSLNRIEDKIKMFRATYEANRVVRDTADKIKDAEESIALLVEDPKEFAEKVEVLNELREKHYDKVSGIFDAARNIKSVQDYHGVGYQSALKRDSAQEGDKKFETAVNDIGRYEARNVDETMRGTVHRGE